MPTACGERLKSPWPTFPSDRTAPLLTCAHRSPVTPWPGFGISAAGRQYASCHGARQLLSRTLPATGQERQQRRGRLHLGHRCAGLDHRRGHGAPRYIRDPHDHLRGPAFRKQSQEVSGQAATLSIQSEQLTQQRRINTEQTRVLALQASELSESLDERKREAE
jgi:hypothetical protein